jgi:tight adherence protein C
VTAWAVAVGWGLVLAAPVVRRARRRRVAMRTAGLTREPPTTGVQRRSRLGAAVGRLPLGPVGRVLGALLVSRRARRREESLTVELPVALDVLGVAVGAGCTPFLAVQVAAHWAPPTIGGHLAAVPRACGLGMSFADALDDMATNTPRLRPLADALLASDRLGAPVGPALQRLAAEERAGLRRRAEAQARTVPVRLLFPLVFLVLPAFGLLTVVPTLVSSLGRT